MNVTVRGLLEVLIDCEYLRQGRSSGVITVNHRKDEVVSHGGRGHATGGTKMSDELWLVA